MTKGYSIRIGRHTYAMSPQGDLLGEIPTEGVKPLLELIAPPGDYPFWEDTVDRERIPPIEPFVMKVLDPPLNLDAEMTALVISDYLTPLQRKQTITDLERLDGMRKLYVGRQNQTAWLKAERARRDKGGMLPRDTSPEKQAEILRRTAPDVPDPNQAEMDRWAIEDMEATRTMLLSLSPERRAEYEDLEQDLAELDREIAELKQRSTPREPT